MKIGIPTEVIVGESRVAATPKTVGRLLKQGFQVSVQSNAGVIAGFTDLDYQEAGATIASSPSDNYAMPHIEVRKAERVVIMKRSMSAGYSGEDNPLFYKENSLMLYGDAKDSAEKLQRFIKG